MGTGMSRTGDRTEKSKCMGRDKRENGEVWIRAETERMKALTTE